MAFADPFSRQCVRIVNEMEDITSLMADSKGMMKEMCFSCSAQNCPCLRNGTIRAPKFHIEVHQHCMNMDKMLYNYKTKEKGKQIKARRAMSIWNHSRHAKNSSFSGAKMGAIHTKRRNEVLNKTELL